MTELERYKRAMEIALTNMCRRNRHRSSVTCEEATQAALNEINAILHPEPQYEDVTVERWECMDCSLTEREAFDICQCSSANVAKLSGPYRRAIPQPVERTLTIIASVGADGRIATDVWELMRKSNPDPRGKTGTLTFTWTDPQ